MSQKLTEAETEVAEQRPGRTAADLKNLINQRYPDLAVDDGVYLELWDLLQLELPLTLVEHVKDRGFTTIEGLFTYLDLRLGCENIRKILRSSITITDSERKSVWVRLRLQDKLSNIEFQLLSGAFAGFDSNWIHSAYLEPNELDTHCHSNINHILVIELLSSRDISDLRALLFQQMSLSGEVLLECPHGKPIPTKEVAHFVFVPGSISEEYRQELYKALDEFKCAYVNNGYLGTDNRRYDISNEGRWVLTVAGLNVDFLAIAAKLIKDLGQDITVYEEDQLNCDFRVPESSLFDEEKVKKDLTFEQKRDILVQEAQKQANKTPCQYGTYACPICGLEATFVKNTQKTNITASCAQCCLAKIESFDQSRESS